MRGVRALPLRFTLRRYEPSNWSRFSATSSLTRKPVLKSNAKIARLRRVSGILASLRKNQCVGGLEQLVDLATVQLVGVGLVNGEFFDAFGREPSSYKHRPRLRVYPTSEASQGRQC